MKRCSSLTIIVVAVGWLLPGAVSSSAQEQGPYYPVPAWDQKLPANTRFVRVLFEEVCALNVCLQIPQGVLDRETGLVWERSPASELQNWQEARLYCAAKVQGGRMGWRLPAVDELTSLLDPSAESEAKLPPGHPFVNVNAEFGGGHWTNTQSGATITDPSSSSRHYLVYVGLPTAVDRQDENHFHVWCVRGH